MQLVYNTATNIGVRGRGAAALHGLKNFRVLQPLRWRCVECVIHHQRDVREEQQYIYAERTSNNRVIAARELYCCLLPRCEALRECRSGFSDCNKGKLCFHGKRKLLKTPE